MYWVRCMGEGTNHTPLPTPHPLPSQSPPLISTCAICTPLCAQMGHVNRDAQSPPPHCHAPSQRYAPLPLSLYPPLSTCSQNGGTCTPCFHVHAIQAPTLYALVLWIEPRLLLTSYDYGIRGT